MNSKEFEEKYPGGVKFEVTCLGDSEPQYQSIQCKACDKYSTYAFHSKYYADAYYCDEHKLQYAVNQGLLDLYERQINNVDGAIYFGKPVNMDDPKEVAAVMYCLGVSRGSQREIDQKNHEFSVLFGGNNG